MKIELNPHELKAIICALISKEQKHDKLFNEYGKEGDTKMKELHFEQANYFYDLRTNICTQEKIINKKIKL